MAMIWVLINHLLLVLMLTDIVHCTNPQCASISFAADPLAYWSNDHDMGADKPPFPLKCWCWHFLTAVFLLTPLPTDPMFPVSLLTKQPSTIPFIQWKLFLCIICAIFVKYLCTIRKIFVQYLYKQSLTDPTTVTKHGAGRKYLSSSQYLGREALMGKPNEWVELFIPSQTVLDGVPPD